MPPSATAGGGGGSASEEENEVAAGNGNGFGGRDGEGRFPSGWPGGGGLSGGRERVPALDSVLQRRLKQYK